MMLRACADCEGIASTLGHALIFPEMVYLPWRCAQAEMEAEGTAALGNAA
jgi:hypothetical protein